MDFNLTTEQQQIREEIKKVCQEFPDAYWRQVDSKKEYPDAFVRKLSELGWLAALIPEEFGGTGLGITEASIILEEINHSGGVATACHAQMYTMGTLLRHGNSRAEKTLPAARSPRESCACRRSASPSPTPARRAQEFKHGHPQRRQILDQRPKNIYLPGAAVRSDAFAGAHHAL